MFGTAFLIGLLGSLHCVGMCGPIVLALPVYKKGHGKILISRALYNAGRIVTYGLIGILIGLVGHGISLAGFQQKLSLLGGVFIILYAVISLSSNSKKMEFGFESLRALIKKNLGKFIQKRTLFSSFLVGFTNGFLPCGLVYLAVGGALASGNLYNSILYMVFFGLGTSFSLFALGYFSNFFGLRLRISFNKWIPYIAFFIGILLIIRGLNLGIPYLSPEISPESEIEMCH